MQGIEVKRARSLKLHLRAILKYSRRQHAEERPQPYWAGTFSGCAAMARLLK